MPDMSYYSFLFTFVHLIRITHLTFHDGGDGFMTKKARYFDDELSHIHEEIGGSLQYFQNLDSLAKLNLRLEPEVLDFRERPLGTPHSRTVTLFNTDSNKSIDLTSISGNTVHFHSSFFEDKQIPPNGNTSFKVVYLGRQEGPVDSTLFLHTSNGFVKYNVKAFGTFNSYRVRPIVDVKLTVNSTFTPVIYMHNPHSKPVQIVEIYSSGGGFHLELPGGQHEGPNDLWEINPHQTKAVIRVRFEAKVPHNYTAYIRIKLHNPEEILIVPLEVEVAETQNIFHPQGHVDFGVGGSLDGPKEVSLCLSNPLKKAVRIHSVSTLSKSIKTQYYNVRINPLRGNENNCINVGTLIVDWKNAWQTQDYHGKIIVKFRNGKNRTEIPYFLSVLKGGLTYDRMSTIYFLNEKQMDTKERKFEVLNEFHHPIKVLEVKFPFDIDTAFKIRIFTPVTIKPFEKGTLFNIWLKSSTKKTNMQLTSHIKLLTNVSEIHVPLLSYNGKLQIHLPFASDDHVLQLGLVGQHRKIRIFFTLSNPNPVEMTLVKLSATMPSSELEVHDCDIGDHKLVFMYNFFGNVSKCDKVPAHGYAVIKITMSTANSYGPMKGEIHVRTPFEILYLPVFYRVAPGELVIDQDDLVFVNCFPGKLCAHPLRVFSSFPDKMFVENIVTMPPDRRVSAAITGTILPKMNRVIGYLYFNPDLDCSPECYVGFIKEGSASWLKTMIVSKQVSEYDLKLVNTFYNRFLNLTCNDPKGQSNITLWLDTSEVKGKIFVSKINYTWPTLIRENTALNSTLEFPLTQVLNSSTKNLILYNPANHNVVVQLLFENDYPHAEMLYDGLPSTFIPSSEVKHTSTNWFAFDTKQMRNQQKIFWDNLQLSVSKQSLPFMLLPGQSKRVNLRFTAGEARAYTNLLFIRNNLTILEVVRLSGKGIIPLFEFAGLKPGDQKPLQFDLTEKQLRACNPDLNQNPYLPNLTVKDSFIAKNLGEIPVEVTSFFINGYPCEGFGFKILDCEPFTLLPNSTKRIGLAFTPDLTLQEVSRVLVIETSLKTYVNYSLRATVSRSYCRYCSLLLERPPWELYMSYVVNIFLSVMMLLVAAVAVLDANAIKTRAAEVYMASNIPPLLPVLDLRKIGRQVREEIQSPLKEKVKVDSSEDVKAEENVRSEPAIVPTTGRSKKKLINNLTEGENSVDADCEKERVRERQKKKDILFERHRLKSRERKTEKELKLLEEKGRKEKHSQQKEVDLKKNAATKKQCKVMQVPTQEGELFSSTTTESSNSSTNCDEVDKENQRLNWTKPKMNVSFQTVNGMVNSKEAQDIKIKHVSFVNSKLRNKGVKTSPMEQDKDQSGLWDKSDESRMVFGYGSANREKRRRDQKFKERKEKLIYRSKNHADRKQHVSESDSINEKDTPKTTSSFYIPLPASTTSCAGWCESKARFSDVVARTDQPNDPSPVSTQSSDSPPIHTAEDRCSRQTSSPFKSAKVISKPTVYVEPYKSIDLGPIGSKRLGTPGSNSPDLFGQEGIHQPTRPTATIDFHPINDKSVIAAVANNTLLTGAGANFFVKPPDDLATTASLDVWPPGQQIFRDITTNRDDRNRTSFFPSPETEEDSWKNITPQAAAAQPPNTDYWSNTFSSVLNSTSKLANNTSYLWGSSPIWKPWSPADSPNPVRRTPPGFDEHIQKKKNVEDEHKRQKADPFNSFGGDTGGTSWSHPWE